jgi:hypothetical protein
MTVPDRNVPGHGPALAHRDLKAQHRVVSDPSDTSAN